MSQPQIDFKAELERLKKAELFLAAAMLASPEAEQRMGVPQLQEAWRALGESVEADMKKDEKKKEDAGNEKK